MTVKSSKSTSRRVRRLADAFADLLQRQPFEVILQATDARADDKLIDEALVLAFAICRTRVELGMRQIARNDATMDIIRNLANRPTFQVARKERAV